jgi:hypothetical protein
MNMSSAYRDDDPSHPVDDLDENATPGLAPAGKPGVDPVELVRRQHRLSV